LTGRAFVVLVADWIIISGGIASSSRLKIGWAFAANPIAATGIRSRPRDRGDSAGTLLATASLETRRCRRLVCRDFVGLLVEGRRFLESLESHTVQRGGNECSDISRRFVMAPAWTRMLVPSRPSRPAFKRPAGTRFRERCLGFWTFGRGRRERLPRAARMPAARDAAASTRLRRHAILRMTSSLPVRIGTPAGERQTRGHRGRAPATAADT